jgi:hypothetical protein
VAHQALLVLQLQELQEQGRESITWLSRGDGGKAFSLQFFF